MTLHIEKHGSEHLPKLVLIHGWGMHGGVWQSLVEKIVPNFNVSVIDLPGMGFSQPLENGNLSVLTDAIARYLPESANICGWSLGGLIAMRLALSHPQRVQRLVLVGSTPCFVNGSDWHYGMGAQVFRKFANQISEQYQTTLIKFLTLQCMGASDVRHTVKQLRESLAARPVPAQTTLQQALDILLQTDLRPEIGHIRQPVLVMHGDKDTLAPLSAGKWLTEHYPMPNCRCLPTLPTPVSFTFGRLCAKPASLYAILGRLTHHG